MGELTLYVGLVVATRLESTRSQAFSVLARSEEEAAGTCIANTKEQFPASDSWVVQCQANEIGVEDVLQSSQFAKGAEGVDAAAHLLYGFVEGSRRDCSSACTGARAGVPLACDCGALEHNDARGAVLEKARRLLNIVAGGG